MGATAMKNEPDPINWTCCYGARVQRKIDIACALNLWYNKNKNKGSRYKEGRVLEEIMKEIMEMLRQVKSKRDLLYLLTVVRTLVKADHGERD